jgi:hypothetical protein
MSVSDERLSVMKAITTFEGRIEKMHLDIQKYCKEELYRMPDWEKLEADLLQFSRRKIMEVVMQKNLDRVLFKFQNRKKIWLRWVDEFQREGPKIKVEE